MAFSFGFFNSKNLDRTYTAENFTEYLSSLICDGIQDNYGRKFALSAKGFNLIIGSGKAWINGHYFVSDSTHTIDLSEYADESLPRYVSVGICCNTNDNFRNIGFDILAGTPATFPAIPRFENTDDLTYLTLCAVRIDGDEMTVTDYRDNPSYCGYVQCILGKCRVTEMIILMNDMEKANEEMKEEIEKMRNIIDDMQTKVDDLTGDIAKAGSLGDDVYYVLYADGKMILRGTGDMYDYNLEDNLPPLRGNNDIKSVVISDGVTSVGDYIFENCQNIESVSLPQSIKTIGESSFMQGDGYVNIVYGLTDITIPPNVTAVRSNAFLGTAIKSINIPSAVTEIGKYVCRGCIKLETAEINGTIIGPYMFTGCEKLKNMTVSSNLKTFGEHALNYCKSLETIIFKGTLKQWQAVDKGTSWDGHRGMDVAQSGLVKIQCFDGYMEYDAENKVWNEVEE